MNETIKKILAETFRIKVDAIDASTSIETIDTWDSLTHMELIANLESMLRLEFSSDEIIAMTSLATIQQIVNEKV
jgi:acyl carrier protein